MATYKVKLKNRVRIAEGTSAFQFEKPEGFMYKAGQFVRLTLINPEETDDSGNRRNFTIASAPHEEDLMFALRVRDTAFKRVLGSLPIGSDVELDGPKGLFTLHGDPAKRAVFLTGGIGVTPVVSIFKDAARRQLPHRLWLFYSNRRPEDTAFMSELQECEARNPNASVVFTMTEMEKSAHQWSGKTGYIDKEMMTDCVGSFADTIFYVTGPGGMVEAMVQMLREAGVSDEVIKTEEFSGY